MSFALNGLLMLCSSFWFIPSHHASKETQSTYILIDMFSQDHGVIQKVIISYFPAELRPDPSCRQFFLEHPALLCCIFLQCAFRSRWSTHCCLPPAGWQYTQEVILQAFIEILLYFAKLLNQNGKYLNWPFDWILVIYWWSTLFRDKCKWIIWSSLLALCIMIKLQRLNYNFSKTVYYSGNAYSKEKKMTFICQKVNTDPIYQKLLRKW